MPEGLACQQVRKVHFDDRHRDGRYCIAQGYGSVAVTARVEHHAVVAPLYLLYPIDEITLQVRLAEFQCRARKSSDQFRSIVGHGPAAVKGRFARAQQVQVGAIDHEDLFHAMLLYPRR